MRRAASRPPRPLLAAALAALCLAGVAGLAHAQAKKATGTSSQVVRVARTELFLGNNPADTGRLESLSRVLASSDPDWNGARVFSVRFSDPFMRQERQARGHMVVTHPGGDQAFLEYHFRWKPSQGRRDRVRPAGPLRPRHGPLPGHHGKLARARPALGERRQQRVGGRVHRAVNLLKAWTVHPNVTSPPRR
jgi:hypothetical protein